MNDSRHGRATNRHAFLLALLGVLGCRARVDRPAPTPAAAPPTAVAASPRAVRLPLRFEENRGQFDSRARFVARQGGLTLYLTDGGSVIQLRQRAATSRTHEQRALPPPPAAPADVLTMRVHDSLPQASLVAGQRLITRSNYFLGNDAARWRSDVPNFGEVRYHGVRPGVDLVYHGSDTGRLEYDFVVAPGASPDVALDVEGARNLRVAADGYLEIDVGHELLRQPPPAVYQEVDGQRRTLAGRYRVIGKGRVGFAVAEYDRARTLVIDPVLSYSTYLGGSSDDQIYGVVLDSAGSAYVSGYTYSANFPIAHALDAAPAGVDAFVAKLTPSGDALVYATYLGGGATDAPWGRAVDASGAVYVAGMTSSADFPLVKPIFNTFAGNYDGFVTKLSPAGDAIVYSTYLGGSDVDVAKSVAVDASGAAYVGGYTKSDNFPVANAYQATKPRPTNIAENGFVAKLTPAGDALAYSTFFGGTGGDDIYYVDVDSAGAAYLGGFTYSTDLPTANGAQKTFGGGWDGFVAKLTPAGNAVAYATYVGGSDDDFTWGFTIDASGAAYISGNTDSTDFPVVNPLQDHLNGPGDCFLTKVTPAGDAFAFSTYFGGSGYDEGDALVADATGAVYIAGATNSTDFPLANSTQKPAGLFDIYVAKLTPAGSALTYSTLMGGASFDEAWGMAVDGSGAAIVAGGTESTNFPVLNAIQTTYAGGQYDGIIFKLAPGDASVLSVAPTSAIVPPRGPQMFVPFGGSGGYQWSLTTNASGGSVDHVGRYAAGTTPNVTDVVTLTDSAGATVSATVHVGAALTVSPVTTSTAPQGSIPFIASGGSGSGYAWTVSLNHSGGSINATTGVYRAGTSANVSDTITVSDPLGNSASATVAVTAGVSISPATPATPPLGAIAFTAAGGSGTSYTWSITSNGSGGTISATSGLYTAGGTGNRSDTVLVVDSLGNSASVNISVGGGLVLNPAAPKSPPEGTIQFSATGGSGSGYAWTLTSNQSGGSIDSTTGKYVAGSTGSVSDTVQVKDSLGNTAGTTIAVSAALQIEPPNPSTAPLGSLVLTVSGGSGAGYAWTLVTNNSGATLDVQGDYKAGAIGSVSDTIQATDSFGNRAQVDITVTAGVSITPPAPSTVPRGLIAFGATGGSGSGYSWSLLSSPSGASLSPSSGQYRAGAIGGVTDRVTVVDSLGNKASVDVPIGAGLSISPAKASLQVGESVDLIAAGGSGTGYHWTIGAYGTAGGRVDSNGHYVAGTIPGFDIVQLADSFDNTAEATITVVPIPVVSDGGTIAGAPPANTGCGCELGGVERSANAGPLLLILALIALTAVRGRRKAGA